MTEGSIPSRQYGALSPAVKVERMSIRRSSTTSASAKMGDADPDAFIQGMQGYQWTDTDLEFVYQAKQQKRVQQLQEELSEVLKVLKAETQRLEMAVASRDKLETELSKTLPCELLVQLCRDVLLRSCSPAQLEGLGEKDLLSQLRLGDVQHVVQEEATKVKHLKREVTKAQEIRDTEEQAMKKIDDCQKTISTIKVNIEALKTKLSALTTWLPEEEEASKAALKPKGGARRTPKTAQATSDALKRPRGKKSVEKEAKEKSTSKVHTEDLEADKRGQPPKTEKTPKSAQAKERVRNVKAKASPVDVAARAPKAPKDKKSAIKKSPKEKTSKETRMAKVHKEDLEVEPADQKSQPPEPEEPLKTSGAPAAARKATMLPKAQVHPVPAESEAGTLRRSKRIATKSQNQSEAVPQKPGSSRWRF